MTNERNKVQAGIDGRFTRQVFPKGNATDEFATDILKPNIGNPRVPALLHYLPGAFLIVAVAAGAVMSVTSKAARTVPAGQDIVTGKAAHAYETGLDAGVPFRDPSVGFWATLNYRLFHEARDGALVGGEGWLFTAEEFQTSGAVKDAEERQLKVDYIRRVRDALRVKGAWLVVVLIPAKVRVYPEKLGNLRVPAENANVYHDFRRQVLALGVPAPDLLTDMVAAKRQGDVFVRTDTHWSPLGAQVAAQVVSSAVRRAYLKLELPAAQFQTTEAPKPSNVGDLLRYLPLPKGEGPQAQRVRMPTTVRTDAGGGGLLGDDPIAAVLVGTSYSAVKEWNFAGALRQSMGTDLVNAATEGQGPVVPMRAYLKSSAYKNTPPKLVIWEIPERYLRVDYPNTSSGDKP